MAQTLCLSDGIPIIFDRIFSLFKEKRAGCFAFIVLRMSVYCKWSVTLPHGAAGWFAVCDYGIF